MVIVKNQKVICLSDGTTQGYKSGDWAEFLCLEFVKKPTFSKKGFQDFLTKTSKQYIKKLNTETTDLNIDKTLLWALEQKKNEESIQQ